MKFLIITQVFYPDTISVSQHISDLAFKLIEEGHSVNVLSSRYPYEGKDNIYKSKDCINSVVVERLYQTSFGKKYIFSRLIDFFTFYCAITIKLFFLNRKKYDIILGTTVPPLLSFIGVVVAKWKKNKICLLGNGFTT